ncbi:MAG TPA: CocE/NonD family hydrolase [Dehalococcoidales bacterium]
MNSIRADFPCGSITLEGELHLPEGDGPFPIVVVCHPHPLYGGNMENNVVMAICQGLLTHSVAAFRFNFRGVGRSGGAYGGGITEREDVKAALAFVRARPEVDAGKIGLAGYSFGATVALPAALQDGAVRLLALISPPLVDSAWQQLKGYPKPKLLMVGSADAFIPAREFQQYAEDMPEPRQYFVIPGADHFWWGYEEGLAQKVSRFFGDGFGQTVA